MDILDMEKALRMILATTDDDGRAHGHWHGVCIKIARAAIWQTDMTLSDKDMERIIKHLPSDHRQADGE